VGPLAGRRVRWGILGTGGMAAEFARALGRLPEAELVAVGSRDASRAQAFARAMGAPRAHGGYERLVADDLDVVYVATPNAQHREHCRLALAAGKAVLCEKPFATSASAAREVFALAREKRLFCMEALWTRFLPLVTRAEALLREGWIGEPLGFTADFGLRVASREDRVFRPELGGGALLDLGVYLVAMARLLLGPTVAVGGEALLGPTGVDEQAVLFLRHGADRHSVLFTTLRSRTPAEAHVLGTRGYLRIHAPFYRPHRLSVVQHPESAPEPTTIAGSGASKAWARRLYQRFEGVLAPIVRRPALSLVEPVEGSGHHYQAAEVMRCLAAGQLQSPRMPPEETIAILETIDELRARSVAPPAGA
jgi:dihydrodiol dehydrogenase / D-xylose 1-dehydrogenase (NADP)